MSQSVLVVQTDMVLISPSVYFVAVMKPKDPWSKQLVRRVHLGRSLEELKHEVHVHKALADLLVGVPDEVKRLLELEQKAVHGDDVADRHGTRRNLGGRNDIGKSPTTKL